jgi:hypothetical protein
MSDADIIRAGRSAHYPFRAAQPEFRRKRLTDRYGSPTRKILSRTSDLAEAVDAVSRVYCPHEVEIRRSDRPVNATLKVIRGRAQPVVGLRYWPPRPMDFHKAYLGRLRSAGIRETFF